MCIDAFRRTFLLLPYPIFGMAIWPLNLLRTLLSIPLGFRHDSFTVLNRSDWWRLRNESRQCTVKATTSRWTDLKGLVRFLTMVILAMAD